MLSPRSTSPSQVDLKVREYSSGSTHAILAPQRFSLETSGGTRFLPPHKRKKRSGEERGKEGERESKKEKESFPLLSTVCLVHHLLAPLHIFDDAVNGHTHGLWGQLPY